MTTRHNLEAAYDKGIQEMNGMDADVARDLGFVTNPEEFEAVLESHRQLNPHIAAQTAAHQNNIGIYHLQTDEQRNMRLTNEQLAEIDSEKMHLRRKLGKKALED